MRQIIKYFLIPLTLVAIIHLEEDKNRTESPINKEEQHIGMNLSTEYLTGLDSAIRTGEELYIRCRDSSIHSHDTDKITPHASYEPPRGYVGVPYHVSAAPPLNSQPSPPPVFNPWH